MFVWPIFFISFICISSYSKQPFYYRNKPNLCMIFRWPNFTIFVAKNNLLFLFPSHQTKMNVWWIMEAVSTSVRIQSAHMCAPVTVDSHYMRTNTTVRKAAVNMRSQLLSALFIALTSQSRTPAGRTVCGTLLPRPDIESPWWVSASLATNISEVVWFYLLDFPRNFCSEIVLWFMKIPTPNNANKHLLSSYKTELMCLDRTKPNEMLYSGRLT